jgi:hypothetical protein
LRSDSRASCTRTPWQLNTQSRHLRVAAQKPVEARSSPRSWKVADTWWASHVGFPLPACASATKASRIVIPTRYKSGRYTWEVDTTAVRRGRLILAVGTVVAEPFERANQGLAHELVSVI